MNHEPLPQLHKLALDPDSGLPLSMRDKAPPAITCRGCNLGHHARTSHKSSVARPPIAHTIAVDLIGLMLKTAEGHQHLMIATELHTRMRLTVLLKRKSQASQALIAIIAHVEGHTGQRVARIRCDNANEFLTKNILAFARSRAINVDPTVPHSPQTNAVAECFNKTLMSRVRATLATMQMPFDKYWCLRALNTVEKLNLVHHSTINEIPRRVWERHRQDRSPDPVRSFDLRQFRAFGEYGHIPVLDDEKTKGDPRSILVRYLSTPRTGLFRVLDPRIGQLLTCRAVDYRPYNPQYDPMRFVSHALPLKEGHKRNVNLHHVQPRMASAVTQEEPADDRQLVSSLPDPPKSLPHARRHRFAAHWKKAYAEECAKLEEYGTFLTVPRHSLPRNAFIPRAKVTFVYKRRR